MKKLLLGVLFFAVLGIVGIVGTMTRNDEESVEEFKREFVVMDAQGVPQLVSLKDHRKLLELYDALAKKEMQHADKAAVR